MPQRKLYIQISFLLVAAVYGMVLMNLQIFNPRYKDAAESNIVSRIELTPLRGVIYDRNGKVLVRNKPVFQLQVITRELSIEDTAVFCEILNINPSYLRKQLQKPIRYPRQYSKYKPFIFIEQISLEEYAQIEDELIAYPGLIIVPNTVRDYPHKSLANVLGYVKEIDKNFLEKDTSNSYKQGDLVGVSGIERYYEKYLRGKAGTKYVMMNAKRVVKGPFSEGEYDTLPQFGHALKTSIDLNLQAYAETLMQNKKGAIVAIEPETGEILTMLTAPSYNPNLLTGKGKQVNKDYFQLTQNPDKPLFNRAIQASYPPGSTFKTLIALVGLQMGVFDTAHTYYQCDRNLVKCHNHQTPVNLYRSLQHSCNPYYYRAIRKIILGEKSKNIYEDTSIGLHFLKEQANKFGLGRQLGIDLPFEKKGLIPSANLYNKKYGKNRWKVGNFQSISIGQGEIIVLPLQLANQAAIIANRGWYITPHIVKEIGETKKALPQYKQIHWTGIDKVYFDFVARAMRDAIKGTAPLACTPDIDICGKTGTAQNPHGKDHSVFMAFAPLENPKISIAVYIENAGFGGSWAAPLASLIIEKYLKGEISRSRKSIENYVKNKNFLIENK